MKQVIQLMEVRDRTFYRPDGHKLVPHGRLAWLHRLLWLALLRLGAIKVNLEETTKVFRVAIDERAIFDRIQRTLDNLHRRNRRPKEILMGPETFAELMHAPEARDYLGPFSFNIDAYEGRTLFGLKVEVLPQMEGLLVR